MSEANQQKANGGNADQRGKNVDVAIVGGGMVGATLALLLSDTFDKHGHSKRIVVVEPGDLNAEGSRPWSPSFDDRSTALSAGTLQVLRQLNLWQSLSSKLAEIRQVKVSDRGHIGFSQFSADDNRGEALGAVIENACLGRVLLQACSDCAGIELIANTEATKLVPKSKAMAIELQTGGQTHTLTADLLVLADGALSQLAASVGVHFDKHNYAQQALIANVSHTKSHNGVAFECFSEQGPLALLPLNDFQGRHRSALVWTHPNDVADQMCALAPDAFLRALQQQFGHRLGRFISVGSIAAYPLSLFMAKEQVRSSLVLMGNAAHLLHPVAGQGFNLAIRDSVELCRQLQLGMAEGRPTGDMRVLQAYFDARRNDQFITTQLSHSFIKMFASDQAVKQVSRNAGLLAVHKIGSIRSAFFKQMMGKQAR